VRLEVHRADGAALPAWLGFDPINGVFHGTPPAGEEASINVMLVARDQDGREARLAFRLELGVGDIAAGRDGMELDSFLLGDGKLARHGEPVLDASDTAEDATAVKRAGDAAKRGAKPFGEQVRATKAARDPLLAKVLDGASKQAKRNRI
jgi:hypothetical protein